MNLRGNVSTLVSAAAALLTFHPSPGPWSDGMLGTVVWNDTRASCNRSGGTLTGMLAGAFGNLSLGGLPIAAEEDAALGLPGTPPRCVVAAETSDPTAEGKNWAALLILAVVVVTVTGNILVIVAVTLERKLHNATNYFLMSLAVADMLLGLIVMPVSMVTILYGYTWPLPFELCPFWIYLDVLLSTASIMHLCAISLDRYIAIRNPLHHSRSNSRTKARAKIAAVWTISVGISMPIPVLGLRDHSKVFRDGSCQLTDDSFVLIGSFVAFFVPLLIMVATYLLTLSALHTAATLCIDRLVPRPAAWRAGLTLSFLPHSPPSSASPTYSFSFSPSERPPTPPEFGRRSMQSISNEQKASKVLGVVFFLFVVMWCPFFVTNVLAVTCDPATCDPGVMGLLLNVFVWVGYLSSAVNPLVYTLFNKTYRTAFARYARCRYWEELKPLQLILVNTIPPLAYGSTPLGNGDFPLLLPPPSTWGKARHAKRRADEGISCV